jgi:iron complex outermembrane receptor protein
MSGPITDRMQAAVALGYAKHDPYLINVNPNEGGAGSENRFNSRFELNYDITPNMSNLVRADYMYTNEHWAPLTTLSISTMDPRFISCGATAASCKFAGYPAPLADAALGNYHYYGSGGQPNNSDIAYGINDLFNWQLNPNLNIKNLVAYRTDRAIWLTTGNGTEFLNGATRSNYDEHQFSDELDFAHTFGNLKGVVGLYGWTEFQRQWADSITITNPQVLKTSPGTDSYQDTRFPTQSYAVYANETYQITPDIGIVAGARYTSEHKALDTYNTSFTWIGTLPAGWPGVPAGQGGSRGATSASTVVLNSDGSVNGDASVLFPFVLGYGNNFPGSPPDAVQNKTAFTPKVGINWQATKDAFLYFSYTQGFKSGGFNFTARNAYGDSYLPEYITTYEVGAKTDWLDHHLRINVAVYRNDWTNLQVSQTVVLPGLSTPVTQSSNAAAARETGLDADITYKPWDGWTFTGSVSWLPDAVYLNYTGGQAGNFIKALLIQDGDPRENAGNNTYNASGLRLNSAPDISAIVTGQKDFDLGNGNTAFIRGEGQYTGNTQFDISSNPIETRNPFAVFNASAGWASPGGHYQVELWVRNLTDKQYFISQSAGSLPEGVPGAPRTFGVQLQYTY